MFKSSYYSLILILVRFFTSLTGGVIGITSIGCISMLFIIMFLNLKYNGFIISENQFITLVLSGVGVTASYWLLVVASYCDKKLEIFHD